MAVFPPPLLLGKEDSAKFSVKQEDIAHRTKMEGGAVYGRPKFTKKPRKIYTTGFTHITQSQLIELQAFWDDMSGTAGVFDWKNPTTDETIRVRFSKDFSAKYVGVGNAKRWDISQIELEDE